MILALAHAGCGMDSGASPSNAQTIVSSHGVAPQEGAAAANVVMGSRGATVEVAANWTIAGNNFDVYVTPADCFDTTTSVVLVFQCIMVASAASETQKPERLSFSGTAGSAYKVFVFNRGAEPDTVTVTLTIR